MRDTICDVGGRGDDGTRIAGNGRQASLEPGAITVKKVFWKIDGQQVVYEQGRNDIAALAQPPEKIRILKNELTDVQINRALREGLGPRR